MIDLWKEKYVVLDLETTGNQVGQGDQVIQIGLCLIEQGEISQQFSTLVKPDRVIPPFIEQLTGIRNQDVEEAPSLEEVVPKLLPFLEGAVLIAHNVAFDLTFLQFMLEEQGYYPFQGKKIDTVELSRILLPNQKSFKLQHLSTDFEMEHHQPHQADSDALATAQLFMMLVDKLLALPISTIQRLLPLAKNLTSDIYYLLRKVEAYLLSKPAELEHGHLEVYRQIALKNVELNRKKNGPNGEERIDTLPLPKLQELYQQVFPAYESRTGQQEMYDLLWQAFTEEKHAFLEVGTGTGKSLAYLTAAVYWAKATGERVLISTNTNALLEQLREKDFPLVQSALPFVVQVAVLKGRNNYLCLRKFEDSLYQEESNYDYTLTKMQLLVWLTQTDQGDREELSLPSGGNDYWLKVQSDTNSCLHARCPWFRRCYYFRAKQAADQSELLITNHSLVLADLATEQAILPQADYWIMDEAHQLVFQAPKQLGKQVSYSFFHMALQRLTWSDRNSMLYSVKNHLELCFADHTWLEQLDRLDQLASTLKLEVEQVFKWLYLLAEEQEQGYIEGNMRSVRLQHERLDNQLWLGILRQSELLNHLLVNWRAEQTGWKQRLQQEKEDLSWAQRGVLIDLQGQLSQIEKRLELLTEMLLIATPQKTAYWLEYEHKGAKNAVTIYQQPLEIASIFTEKFLPQKSIIFTSATLQVRNSFKFLKRELGLEEYPVLERELSSPFNYSEQAALFIPNYLQVRESTSDERFIQSIISEMLHLCLLAEGRSLILFTSYLQLRKAYQELKEPLQEQGIQLLAQGIDTGSRRRLAKRFQEQEKAVLLGTNTFWEGIDIPGDDLACLMMVKLPFSPPNSPYYEAKAEQLKAKGKNAFMDYALPQAIIRFKQGFGRLIRTRQDKGIVILFDQRIVEKNYGKWFLQSLPPLTIKSLNKEELEKELSYWLA